MKSSTGKKNVGWIARTALGMLVAFMAVVLLGRIAFAAPLVTFLDDQGVDDEPGQKDLSFFSVDYSPSAGDIAVTWGLDDTMWSGSNTGDACTLFDTDNDGLANYSLCITVEDAGVFLGTRLYSCDADSRADRCAQPTEITTFASTGSASVVPNSDPFGTSGRSNNDCDDAPDCLTEDTISNLTVEVDDVGGGNAVLLNVCTYPSRQPNSDPSDCVVSGSLSPNLTLVKSVTESNYDAEGDILHYTLVATNDGGILLEDVTISDPKLINLTCTPSQPVDLAPGQSISCTGTYTATQADVDAGMVDNTATATGTPPSGPAITDTDSKSVPAAAAPHITIVKSATEAKYDAAGDVLHYTLVATNDGNVTLTGVNISDPKLGTLVCTQPVTLAPGASLTCTGSYTATQGDVNSGKVDNTASTTGTPPTGPAVTDTDSESVPAAAAPHITIVKSATEANYDAAGDVLHYTLVATNDGNVTLTGVTISDPKLGTLVCTQPVTLAPGQSLSCTGSYTVTQGDVNGGKVDNTASTTGTPPTGPAVTDTDSKSVPAAVAPHITIVKSATEANYDAAGDVLHYTLVATNDGNVTLTGVTISDPKLGTLVCTQPVTLAPGTSLTCTGSYTVTQGDVNGGKVDNTASTTGTPPTGPAVTDTDSKSVPSDVAPHIMILKSVTESSYDAVGDVLHYTLVATNDGSLTLTGVTISDPKLGTLLCNPVQPATLAPGASLTCTGDYTVTQADIDAGKVDNTASTTGTPPTGPAVTDTDSKSVPAAVAPHITIVKSVAQSSYNVAGSILNYTLVATNDGNVTLTGVTISDPKLGTLVCTQPVTLAPGQSLSCTGSYTVTQGDVNSGKVDNTASTTGTPPTGPAVTDTDSKSVPAATSPHITLVKSATESSYDAAGDILHYTLVATNDGNSTLTGVTISDPKLSILSCIPLQPATLTPGQTLTCTGSYTVTQGDVDGGTVDNNAAVTGTPPTGPAVTDTDSKSVPAAVAPHITIVKSATESSYDAVGDVLHYTLVATNDGNVTLTGVTISDPKLGTLVCTQPVTLAPGQSLSCTGNYTVTQGDVDAGKVDNSATATGTPPTGQPVTNTTGKTVVAITNPELTLLKRSQTATFTAVGEVIQYTYQLTNSGNVTLFAPFTVSDDKTTVTCPATPTTLAPGASLTCTASYTVTQVDLDAGFVTNIAVAQAKGPTNENVPSNPITSNEDEETVLVPTDPTSLPTGEQPQQQTQSIFLPSVQSGD